MTTDTLPSWNEGMAKTAILDFVARVTKEGGPDFVPAAERIAMMTGFKDQPPPHGEAIPGWPAKVQ